jgi:hypothetical protein
MIYWVSRLEGLRSRSELAAFQSFEEAEAFVLARGCWDYERDADNPGCANAFTHAGELLTIEQVPA